MTNADIEPTPPYSWPVAIGAGVALVAILLAFKCWPGLAWWVR